MNKEIRDRRYELLVQSVKLRDCAKENISKDKSVKLRELEEKKYKQWQFYNGLIKAFDEVKQ